MSFGAVATPICWCARPAELLPVALREPRNPARGSWGKAEGPLRAWMSRSLRALHRSGPPEQQPRLLRQTGIALARALLQNRAVPYDDPPAHIVDCADALKSMGSDGDARPSHPEHHAHEFLGKRKRVVICAVMSQQEPAREPLRQSVPDVADSGIRDLRIES